MDDEPSAMRAHAACEETPRAKDGARAWLGLAVIAVCAACTALALGVAAWFWLLP